MIETLKINPDGTCGPIGLNGGSFFKFMSWLYYSVKKIVEMLILKYFTKSELLQLNTANIFSVLFYNSEIWHSPTLKTELKKKLNSISAAAIKTCMFYPDRMLSFRNTHKINNRAMLESVMTYQLAL